MEHDGCMILKVAKNLVRSQWAQHVIRELGEKEKYPHMQANISAKVFVSGQRTGILLAT